MTVHVPDQAPAPAVHGGHLPDIHRTSIREDEPMPGDGYCPRLILIHRTQYPGADRDQSLGQGLGVRDILRHPCSDRADQS